jgi:uncharacterized protein with von Willebrand factor type A (vWA) domain
VRRTLPQAESALVEQAVAFVQRLRRDDLSKKPGIAETLDWVRALHRLDCKALPEDPLALQPTLACLLKTREDRLQLGPERVRQIAESRQREGMEAISHLQQALLYYISAQTVKREENKEEVAEEQPAS